VKIELNRDWTEFLRLLISRRVKFLLIGGHAVAGHGEPRLTEDLDVFVDRSAENAKRLREALVDFGFGSVAPPSKELSRPHKVFMLGRKPWRIDILTSIDGGVICRSMGESRCGSVHSNAALCDRSRDAHQEQAGLGARQGSARCGVAGSSRAEASSAATIKAQNARHATHQAKAFEAERLEIAGLGTLAGAHGWRVRRQWWRSDGSAPTAAIPPTAGYSSVFSGGGGGGDQRGARRTGSGRCARR
jgi:hypothetical protein